MHQQLKKSEVMPMDINHLYPNASTSTNTCEVAGKKYRVVRHYVGNKKIDKVVHDLAIKQAYNEIKII